MSRLTSSRRNLLRYFGLTAAAAAPVFRRGVLHAAEPTAVPKRFLALWHCNGRKVSPRKHRAGYARFPENLWYPGKRGESYDLASTPNPWPKQIAPLQPHHKSLLLVDGLGFNVHKFSFDNHTKGPCVFLTGLGRPGEGTDENSTTQNLYRSDKGAGISLDQHLAAKIGAERRFRSIEFGLSTLTGIATRAAISYRGPSQPNYPEVDPLAAYTRIFGDLSGGADQPERTAALESLRTRRKSVLDYVSQELTSMKPWVPTGDRARLEAHLESVSQVEKALDAAGAASPACTPQKAPARLDTRVDDNIPAATRIFFDLFAAALACGRTQVASLMWGFGTQSFNFKWGGYPEYHMHRISHWDVTDNRQPIYTDFLAWYSQQFAYLLDKLAAIPESDGKSLLYHSLILWGTDNSDGHAHTYDDLPFLLAGNAGGKLRTGRCETFAQGTPHNRLLITVSHAMDAPVRTFGNPTMGDLPLPGLLV